MTKRLLIAAALAALILTPAETDENLNAPGDETASVTAPNGSGRIKGVPGLTHTDHTDTEAEMQANAYSGETPYASASPSHPDPQGVRSLTGEGTHAYWEGRASIFLNRTVVVPYFYGSNSHADGLETTVLYQSKDNIIKEGEEKGMAPRIVVEVRMKRDGFWTKTKNSILTGLGTVVTNRSKSKKDVATNFGIGFATEWITSGDVGELRPEIDLVQDAYLAFDPVPYYAIWTGYYRQAVKGRVDNSRALVYGDFAGVDFVAIHRSHSHMDPDLPQQIPLHDGAH